MFRSQRSEHLLHSDQATWPNYFMAHVDDGALAQKHVLLTAVQRFEVITICKLLSYILTTAQRLKPWIQGSNML